MLDISVLILTYNEEIHIERCILNAKRFAKEVFVVDSFSTDETIKIAAALGAKVFQNKWEQNYARQFNWGLDHLPFQTSWVFRLDADEYLTDELIKELQYQMPQLDKQISGLVFERKMIFMNKLINRGMIQMNMLRLFKVGHGRCEDRWMDEHIILSNGHTLQLKSAFIDHNLNTLGWWLTKHNHYSIREAIDMLDTELYLFDNRIKTDSLNQDAAMKRAKKLKYVRLPLFWRAFFYFLYRYVFKGGFLQGTKGFLWHFLQGWWYRTIVDAKIYEIKQHCGSDPDKIKKYIQAQYQIVIE